MLPMLRPNTNYGFYELFLNSFIRSNKKGYFYTLSWNINKHGFQIGLLFHRNEQIGRSCHENDILDVFFDINPEILNNEDIILG
jgi:hypothetical protein